MNMIIRHLLVDMNMTTTELARASGLSRPSVSAILNGKRTSPNCELKMLNAIFMALEKRVVDS